MPQEIFHRFSTCLMGWCRNADDYGCVFNIAMEPFRALVGDNLRTDQRTLGLAYKQH
jgi:maltose/moltooligosaccharide transporter